MQVLRDILNLKDSSKLSIKMRKTISKLEEIIIKIESDQSEIIYLNQKIIILNNKLEKQKLVTYGLLKNIQKERNNGK